MTYKKEAGSVAKSRHYKIIRVQFSGYILNIVGVDCGEGPPVPIPNTEVKLTCAEDTWRAAARENRKAPTLIFLVSSVGRARGC